MPFFAVHSFIELNLGKHREQANSCKGHYDCGRRGYSMGGATVFLGASRWACSETCEMVLNLHCSRLKHKPY